MHYVIGTDEAGFGPNLGPLVISASAWRLEGADGATDLYGRLGDCISTTPPRRSSQSCPTLAFADSKRLYKPGKGMQHLERGLLAALASLGTLPENWSQLWQILAPEAAEEMPNIPWYADYERPIPTDVSREEIQAWETRLDERFQQSGVRLTALRSRACFARHYNQIVQQYQSKGAALSHTTLTMVAGLLETTEAGCPITVICDKHGGRNRYGGLLSEHFPEYVVEVVEEGRERSHYRLTRVDRRIEIHFQMKAESHLPVALASMASKYLRELAMGAFNSYWCRHVPELKPTAGYPQDAKRFRDQVEPIRARLNIDDEDFWRTK